MNEVLTLMKHIFIPNEFNQKLTKGKAALKKKNINEVATICHQFVIKGINKRLRWRLTGLPTWGKRSKKSFSVGDEMNTAGSENGSIEALSEMWVEQHELGSLESHGSGWGYTEMLPHSQEFNARTWEPSKETLSQTMSGGDITILVSRQ